MYFPRKMLNFIYIMSVVCGKAFEREVGTHRAVIGKRSSSQLMAILTENFSNVLSMD
jgi:hypothetical protein